MRMLVAGALVAAVLAGCGDGGPLAPPVVRWDEDVCARCAMTMVDRRFGGAIVEEGRARVYDDVSDLALDLAEGGDARARAVYVRDYFTDRWLAAPDAAYLRSEAIQSPMGSGIASFATIGEAERARKEFRGRVLTWAEVREGGG